MSGPSTEPTQDSDFPTESGLLPKWLVGLVFLTFAALMVYVLLFMVMEVIAPMTKTPQFTEQLIEAAKEEVEEKGIREGGYSVDFLVGLEYAAAHIRTVNVQIASAAVGGFFLVVVGVLLFAIGVLKPFSMEARVGKSTVNWRNGAPGVFCALLGTVIMAIGILKPAATLKEISFSKQPMTGAVQANANSVEGGISGVPENIDESYISPLLRGDSEGGEGERFAP